MLKIAGRAGWWLIIGFGNDQYQGTSNERRIPSHAGWWKSTLVTMTLGMEKQGYLDPQSRLVMKEMLRNGDRNRRPPVRLHGGIDVRHERAEQLPA